MDTFLEEENSYGNAYYLTMDSDLKFLRKGERVAAKHAHVCNHVVFLKRCIAENIVPKGLRLVFPYNSHQSMKIKLNAEKLLLRERLCFWKKKRAFLFSELMEFRFTLFSTFTADASSHNWSLVLTRKDYVFQRVKAKQMRKFHNLKVEEQQTKGKGILGRERSGFMDNVINLSSICLSNDEKSLLSKGMKFVPSHTVIPYEEFIVGVEEVASKLDANGAEELRSDVREILNKCKVPNDNLNAEERRALQSLRKKKKCVIFSKADKGNSTVIMDRMDYSEKLERITSGGEFIELKKDITEAEGRKLCKLLMECEKKGELERFRRLNLTVKALRCPVMFGLPKLHKPGIPLRPIVSYVDSPTYLISKELARILRPIHGNSQSNIKDSGDMCDFLYCLNVPDHYLFVSYDVVNLFGSIPAEEAANLAIERLKNDVSLSERTSLSVDSISSLLLFCVRSNYFKCNGTFFKTSSCPMGSPLSPALASIFMETFEEQVLGKTNCRVLAWKRYVDDTFVVIEEGQEERFLDELNSQHVNIKFTYEKEVEKELSFLDIKIKRCSGGINTSIYRKDTSTDRYLDYTSSHCSSVKWGLVSCLGKRAMRICRKNEDRVEELKYLEDVFKRNGYPVKTVNRRLRKINSSTDRGEDTRTNLKIPYVPGISEKVLRVARKHELQVRFMKGQSLGCILNNTKLDVVPQLEIGGVIYRQECDECNLVYIGETSRKAIVRKKEHEKCVKDVNIDRSAIAEHCHKLHHKVNFEKFSIIKKENNWKRRKLKEGIEIIRHQTFNRDEGVQIDRRWRRFLV